MAHTEILLVKPVPNLGGEGEQLKVKAGYARNYLIPRKLAIPATQANKRHVEALNRRRQEREATELSDARALAEKIGAMRLSILVKTGEEDRMFGSVTTADLAEKLKEAGIEIERKRIHLDKPVKSIGDHKAEMKLHAEVTATLQFEVLPENPQPSEGA